MFQWSLTGGSVRCVHSSQECYIYYTSACSNAHSLGAVYGMFIAHKNVAYFMLHHVPMLTHLGRCTVYSYLTRMLYILYFSMFQCSLTWGGVRFVHCSKVCYIYYTSACSNAPSLGAVIRCVHCSQESYIYYTSACSSAHSLGAVYGVFIAHKNVIYILYFSMF